MSVKEYNKLRKCMHNTAKKNIEQNYKRSNKEQHILSRKKFQITFGYKTEI